MRTAGFLFFFFCVFRFCNDSAGWAGQQPSGGKKKAVGIESAFRPIQAEDDLKTLVGELSSRIATRNRQNLRLDCIRLVTRAW